MKKGWITAMLLVMLVSLPIPMAASPSDHNEGNVIYPKPFEFYPDLYTAPFFEAYVLKDFHSESTGVSTYGLATADFNRDGRLDIVVGWRSLSDNHGHITIFYGRGDGSFKLENIREYSEEDKTRRTPLIRVEDIDAADFDNDLDGDVDFVVGSNNGKIKLFKNNGNGTFRDIGKFTLS